MTLMGISEYVERPVKNGTQGLLWLPRVLNRKNLKE